MSALDILATALTSLQANVLRSVLTTLGIIIGSAAVIVTVGVGAGAEAKVDALIASIGANLLFINPGAARSGGARLGGGSRPSLTEDDAAAIRREIESVQYAGGTFNGVGQVVYGRENWSTRILGISPDAFYAREWRLEAGRLYNEQEVRSAAKVALVGETVVQKLFGESDPIGETVRLKHIPFRVIGRLGPKGETPGGRDQDDVVFVPVSTAKKRLHGGRAVASGRVSSIVVKVFGPDRLGEAVADIEALLRQRHRIREGEQDDFSVRNLAEVLEQRQESARIMSLVLAAVASVALLVGGIGIMNIMLVSVTERTREIGIRMAIGATRGRILAQFLTESIVLCAAGGVFGIGLGLGGAEAIARAAGWPMLVEPRAVWLAFAFSAAVGTFFGYYPARKASRLHPIDALRYE